MNVRSAEPGSLGACLDDFFRLHAMRWEGRGESALTTPEGEATLRAFCEAALKRGWLRLLILEAEGSPVAAFLGWRVGDSYASYNTGFDPAWSKRAVGTVMTSVAIRNAIEEDAKEFDFLLGTEPYKRNFTPEARQGVSVLLTGALRPTRLLVAGEARARQLGRRVADRPALSRAARAVARVLPTSRG
jgi:CelD/BcsL family acetyltransferase involved in cellulose biosynthesis